MGIEGPFSDIKRMGREVYPSPPRSGVSRGVWGVQVPPPSEIPKALQNRAKRNPIFENC